MRFSPGDRVELPKRLHGRDGSGREGVVQHAWLTTFTDRDNHEKCSVARLVAGELRHTIVREDELFRLGPAQQELAL